MMEKSQFRILITAIIFGLLTVIFSYIFPESIFSAFLSLIFLILFFYYVSIFLTQFTFRRYIFLLFGLLFLTSLMVNGSNYLLLIKNDYIRTVVSYIWTIMLLISLPGLGHITGAKLLSWNKFITLIAPTNRNKRLEEIKREDSVIIDIIAFFQTVIFLNYSGGSMSFYQLLALLGFIIFIIPRGIGIIKDNNQLRKISMRALISVLVMDIGIIVFNYVDKTQIMINLGTVLKLPLDLMFVIFFFYAVAFSGSLFDALISLRYD